MLLSRRLILLFINISLFLFLTACSDDDEPMQENVEEVITTMRLTFTPQNGGTSRVFSATDFDADGPQNIVIEDVTIDANTSYDLEVSFLNESTFSSDVTSEIREEGNEHQIFFMVNPASLIVGEVNYADQDENGLPIGLKANLITGNGGFGSITVTLKHQPNLKTANSTVDDGSTDFTATFNLGIEQ